MNNEYYGAASTPTEDFLVHYGVRGMKWGVRKAIAKGNMKALSKQYKKASKKLSKLEKQAANVSKYKKRAIGMGAGAALAGGLAAAGTEGVSKATRGVGAGMARGSQAVGKALAAIPGKSKVAQIARKGGEQMFLKGSQAGIAVQGAGSAIGRWGRSTSASDAARKFLDSEAVQNLGRGYHGFAGQAVRNAGATVGQGASTASRAMKGVSNNTLARIGAGAVGVGLAAGAARNAYKAKTAQKKAAQFRSEMNKAFAGTQYANARPANASKKKKKNRG